MITLTKKFITEIRILRLLSLTILNLIVLDTQIGYLVNKPIISKCYRNKEVVGQNYSISSRKCWREQSSKYV